MIYTIIIFNIRTQLAILIENKMILDLLKLNLKNSGMRYPNARKCIRMREGSIQMPRRAFRYARIQNWVAEAKGIQIPKDGIQMPKAAIECP